ncbi:MAG: phosphotransferase [Saprospiraceae bacterium]|nr:phosphotransferase [Saprospiraceae bacterium]
MFQLNANEPQALAQYLKQRKWLSTPENIKSVSIPGEGNMNYVLRIDTGERTLIVKQSRDYVEKYPHVAAPANRAVIEGIFYQTISTEITVQKLMPALIGLDKQNHILVLEDLGMASDFTFLYHLNKKLNLEETRDLVHYLNKLHQHFQRPKGSRKIANLKMRKLNHEHIFHYPFLGENGFDLDTVQTGLQAVAMKYKKDAMLKKSIAALGKVYLSSGDTLLHGDFYPGSWLKTEQGIKIIDPEFCFYGCKEFDLAVMIAHLYLTNHEESTVESVLNDYSLKTALDMVLLNQFVGVEIMRRLIGLAQLPLKVDLVFRQELLDKAYKFLVK